MYVITRHQSLFDETTLQQQQQQQQTITDSRLHPHFAEKWLYNHRSNKIGLTVTQ